MTCVDRSRVATIVVVEESAAVLELVEQALRDRGDRVLATRNAFEALEVFSRLHVDLFVLGVADHGSDGLERDVRSLQPDVRIISIGAKPVSLTELVAAVAVAVTALS